MSSSARAGRSGENFPSTISSSFSDGARSQLFWLGNDTPVAALGEPVQGQLQALRIEFRSLGNAMSLMQENERESRPLWGKLPFNNQLFIFRRRAFATVLAGE